MKVVPISVRKVHATPYPAHVIEEMGRICYQSEPKVPCPYCEGRGFEEHMAEDGPYRPTCGGCNGTGSGSAESFVRMLIKRGHESVLEHVSAGFRIVTDRGVTHELVRHRIAAFSQESTRYCDYAGDRFGGELSFIEPPFEVGEQLRDFQPPTGTGTLAEFRKKAWRRAMEMAATFYKELREHGTPPELARSVLPNALKSEIGMTCNAREWRHILRLRLSPKAHPQMQQVMKLIANKLVTWCPVLFEDITSTLEATP